MSVAQQQEEIVAMNKKEAIGASPSAEQPPLQRLCQDLRKHFDQFGNGPEGAQRVSTMMSDYIQNHEDWKEYALYHPAFYARNLVECNDHFELIVRRTLMALPPFISFSIPCCWSLPSPSSSR
jgi:hypothetical protein